MPEKKKAPHPPKKLLPKKKTANRQKIRHAAVSKTANDSVGKSVEKSIISLSNKIADTMMHKLDNIVKENRGLTKAKTMLFGIVEGVDKAAKRFAQKYPLTPEQEKLLYKEMKMIAEGTGLHGVDVDFQDNILGGIL